MATLGKVSLGFYILVQFQYIININAQRTNVSLCYMSRCFLPNGKGYCVILCKKFVSGEIDFTLPQKNRHP